jgi:hypothetical protein
LPYLFQKSALFTFCWLVAAYGTACKNAVIRDSIKAGPDAAVLQGMETIPPQQKDSINVHKNTDSILLYEGIIIKL